jgi:hypothetical protein
MHGVKDFTPLYNTTVISNISPAMYRAIGFKFEEDSKVLLSRQVNYTVKKDAFTKKSVEGNYTQNVYEIEDAVLKTSNDDFFCLMYRLKGMGDQLFYQEDLVKVLFSEKPDAADQERINYLKKKARAKKKRERQ